MSKRDGPTTPGNSPPAASASTRRTELRHQLTAPFLLDQLAAGRPAGTLEGATLFVDLSGFTVLTSSLMQNGAEGAEVLAVVLDAIFAPLLERIQRHGGFVAGFAGDAVHAIFPETPTGPQARPSDRPPATHRAVAAAWEIRQHLLHHPHHATRFGDFTVTGKVGVASGPIHWRIWQASPAMDQGQRAAGFFVGPALADSLAAEAAADAGQVVVSATVAAGLPRHSAGIAPLPEKSGPAPARLDSVDPDWIQRVAHSRPWSAQDPAGNPGRIPEATMVRLAEHFYPRSLLQATVPGEFRRVVTVFVALAAPDEALMAHLFALLRRTGGFLCRISPSGPGGESLTLLLFWGAPTNTENDILQALDFLHTLRSRAGAEMRAGMTTGLAFAGFVGSPQRQEYTCYGVTVNQAARQQNAAAPGEIWLDQESARQTAARFRVAAHGVHAFKGFAEPQPVFRLEDAPATRHTPSPADRLFGRAAETARLRTALEPLQEQRFAGAVIVMGEAGMGKSSLVHQALNAPADQESAQASPPRGPGFLEQQGIQYVLCQADEILRQPLNPFRYWLQHYFDQTTAQDGERLARVHARLDELIRVTADPALAAELDRTRSFLAALVDLHIPGSLYDLLEPQLRYVNTLDALKALIKAESRRRPLLLHLEDAHWLDDESRDFLHKLVRNVDQEPFGLVITCRPEPLPAPLLPDTCPQTRLHLAGLDGEDVAALAQAILVGPVAPSLRALLLERAGGNPFFAEQITRYLHEQGLLIQTDRGWQMTEDALDAAAVLSGDLRAVLTARLDRLPDHVRRTVQTAAVLGREFDIRILLAMLDQETETGAALDAGQAAAIWSAVEETRYLFRHALLRDAAYDMQLRARLRSLHGAAARAMRSLFAAELAPRYADLAYHYDRAGDPQEAVGWYDQAGRRAAEQYANGEAARLFARAVELTPVADPAARGRRLLAQEDALNWLGERNRQEPVLTGMQETAQQVDDPALRALVYLRLAEFARHTNDYPTALAHVTKAVELAAGTRDGALEARVHAQHGRLLLNMSRFEPARTTLDRAVTLAEAAHAHAVLAQALYDLGRSYDFQDAFPRATHYFQAAIQRYRQVGDRKGIINCTNMFGTVKAKQGDYAAAQELCEEALALCRETGWRYGETDIVGNLGVIALDLGNFDRARTLLQEALATSRELNDQEGTAIFLDTLGLAAHFSGDCDAARSAYEEALAIQDEIGDERGAAYTLTHLGYCLLESPGWPEAREPLARGLAIRRRLDAQSSVAMENLAGLAWLALRRGDHAAAAEQIDPVLAWLGENSAARTEYPVQLYLTCHRVLHGLGRTDEARVQLHRGHSHLRELANAIQAPELRRSFLQNIPFNRALLAAWEDQAE